MSKIRKILYALILLTIVSYVNMPCVSAEEEKKEYTEGNFKYTVDEENVATIISYTGKESKVYIPEKLGDNPVYYIGDSAFEGNKYLETLYLSKKIRKIGNSAFERCTSLIRIEWACNCNKTSDDGFYLNERYIQGSKYYVQCSDLKDIGYGAFCGCNKLKNVHLPKNVENIGEYAFYDCKDVESIYILDNVKFIGKYAFSSISNLKELIFCAENLTDAGSGFGQDDKKIKLIIDEGVKVIPSCFIAGKILEGENKQIYIPNSVYKIGAGAFARCEFLDPVHLSDNIEYIGQKAFYKCKGLKDLNLPSKLKTIKSAAFYKCIDIISVTIPESVEEIEYGAFYELESLERINFNAKLSCINYQAINFNYEDEEDDDDCIQYEKDDNVFYEGISFDNTDKDEFNEYINEDYSQLASCIFKKDGNKGGGITLEIGDNVTDILP